MPNPGIDNQVILRIVTQVDTGTTAGKTNPSTKADDDQSTDNIIVRGNNDAVGRNNVIACIPQLLTAHDDRMVITRINRGTAFAEGRQAAILHINRAAHTKGDCVRHTVAVRSQNCLT